MWSAECKVESAKCRVSGEVQSAECGVRNYGVRKVECRGNVLSVKC